MTTIPDSGIAPHDGSSSARDSAFHDAERDYNALAAVVRAVAGSASSEEALEAVCAQLRDLFGVQALLLEVVRDSEIVSRTFGDPEQLALALSTLGRPARGAQPAQLRTLAIPARLPEAARIILLLSADTDLPEALLGDLLAAIAVMLDREELARRLEAAERLGRRRIEEVGAIYEIGQAIDQIELSDLLKLITERAAQLMEAQACSLMLVNEETRTLRVAASHGLPESALEHEQRMGEGIAGRVAQSEQPVCLSTDPEDPLLEGLQLRPEVCSSMLVPMKNQDAVVMGVLAIRRHFPAPEFTPDDMRLSSVFARQAALALANVRLYSDLKRSAAELLKISTLSRALISTLDLNDLLARVADDIRAVVGFERCCLFMRDAHRGVYVPSVWPGYPDAISRNPVREGEGAVGAAARCRGILTFDAREPASPDRIRERSYLQLKGFARSLGTDAFVAVPILTSQSRCIGVVIADNRGRREPITREQKSLLSAFVNQAGIAIENARLYEEMQENYQNIHRLKNYTDNVLQSIGGGIISTDARGYVARWNRAAEETLRHPSSLFRDAQLSEVIVRLGLPDQERDHLLGIIHRVVETGERIHLHKLKLHPKGRAPMAINLMLSRLTDHNQERAGVVLIFEDVTQEVRLEAEVEKMRRLADIGQLAAKMAHEVRNALSPIRGAAQIMRVEAEALHGATEWPDIIVAEVDNLSRLTSEMLDFARPTPLDPCSISVHDFLQSAIQSLSTFLQEHNVEVRWGVPVDLPDLTADPVQLGQVVRNIVMNAAQAMPEGGELFLHADFNARTGMLAIRFRDTGTGIATEELDRIFRPFVTTKTKGTGLGLPIVQKIVDHHGGRVEVESRLGDGTSFSVLLPLKPTRDKADIAMEEAPLISARHDGPFPDK